MTLSSVRTRILASAAITGLLAVVAVWATMGFTVAMVLPRPEVPAPPVLAAACRADPAGWVGVRLGNAWVTGYDPTGRSAAGTRIDLGSWPAVAVGGSTGRRSDNRWLVLTHAADDGPCAWIVADDGPPEGLVRGFRWGASLGAAVAILLVGAVTWGFAVAPLLRRIERIRGAAVQVGADGYLSADDRVGDALAEIGAGLDRSHARIEADRAALVERHEGLERYLAEIAHDLRTPLGSLLLAVQEVHAEAGTASARRALGDVAYLTALVENLHQAARLRYGLDAREGTADLREVVDRLGVRFRALGDVAGVAVAVAVPDGPVKVRCTPVLAERAIANLLHNALSHGARHVAGRLSVEGDGFVLGILDDGPGVPDPGDLSTYTVAKERPRGPGLGLAITNEIAKRAGWTIS